MNDNVLIYVVILVAVVAYCLLRQAQAHWERERLGPFRVLLQPQQQQWLDGIRRDVEDHALLVERHVAAARSAWAEDPSRALQRLRLACEVLEQVVQPSLTQTISELRAVARTVSVIAPPRPLALAAFRLWRLRGLVGLVWLAHWLLITGRDRARVRLWFLGRAGMTVIRLFLGAALLQARRPQWYMTTEDAAADLRTVESDLVVTAEAILEGMAAWQANRPRAWQTNHPEK